MINWGTVKTILFPKTEPFPNLEAGEDELFPEGLTMGTLFIGRQGTGKTSSLALHLLDYKKKFPERAIFILDWSGSLTDILLELIAKEPKPVREALLKRTVYDELGNPEIVIPMPEFSTLYGTHEEQVQRVKWNLERLAPHLVEGAPLLGGLGLKEIAPQVFRLLTAIENAHGETWQITEAKKLIVDAGMMRVATRTYGYKVPEAKWFLEKVFMEIKPQERELRSYALLALLGMIESRETRARVGYYRPGWTPKEAIEKGLMVLVNGARLINQRNTQHYLFTQVYSLIMQEINKRQPGNPNDKPVALVMDEVYSLLSIPGMAEEIGMLSPLYRSRKLELYVVLQALSQLSKQLREQIWSIGNVVSFAVSNFDEAYEIAQQLFSYRADTVKSKPKSDSQQPVFEPDRGQYLEIANWIQRLNHRECIMRRYVSEKVMDRYIRHIRQTKEHPNNQPEETVWEIKERLLKERGKSVRDALEVINQRNITIASGSPPKV